MDLALNNLQWLICHKTKEFIKREYYLVCGYESFISMSVAS